MKRCSAFLLITLASFVIVLRVSAQVPNVISYQGRLTTPAGSPVPDAGYTVVFTIYDAATGGISKWTETQSVTTSGGLFSVPLGAVVPISDTVFSGSTRYLGIKIAADPELTPRTALIAVPYAHRVSTVDGATGGTISGNSTIQNDLIVSGNVGVGTATPWDKLHVAGAIRADQFRGPLIVNGGNITYAADGGDHIFTTGTIERMRVTVGGNVGIGSTSPGEKLTVAGMIQSTSGGVKFPDGSIQTAAISAHYIGESYGGGIVFYVYDNGQHGLIASTSDQMLGVHWGVNSVTFSRGDGIGAGSRNTCIMIARQPAADPSPFAAKVCSEYSVTSNGVTYGDWYLPSLHELRLLYAQQVVVGAFAGGTADYWSSNEDAATASGAWRKRFSDGSEAVEDKYATEHVRAIRSF
jgi:hypothetical protein